MLAVFSAVKKLCAKGDALALLCVFSSVILCGFFVCLSMNEADVCIGDDGLLYSFQPCGAWCVCVCFQQDPANDGGVRQEDV